MHTVKWQVGLSNGENFKEDKGQFETSPGALSPWQRLLAYLEEHQVTITSLSLCTDDGRRWNLPSAGKNPKFKAFADAPQPVGYRFYRKLGGDVMNGAIQQPERYAVVEATYEDGHTMQLWVDDATQASWCILA